MLSEIGVLLKTSTMIAEVGFCDFLVIIDTTGSLLLLQPVCISNDHNNTGLHNTGINYFRL